MDFSAKMLRDDALKGKVIVVTGGGSGLGKAMTKYFLELGANVAITSRDLDKLKATASELETSTSGKCLPLQCDVRHYDQVENMLAEVLKTFGKVDILLNNAGMAFKGDDFNEHIVRTTLETNYYGTVELTEKMIKHIKESGKIIIVGS